MLEETLDSIDTAQRPAAGAGSIVFDAKAALERLDGDEELFGMLVAVFQQDSFELYEQLVASIASGDLAEAQRAAHSLKGLCANFDAKHATDAAFKIEDLARRRTSAGLQEGVSDLCEHLDQLRSALAHWQA
jgi:HPt (histidine-containing phosphotransfer) domain-containing protein